MLSVILLFSATGNVLASSHLKEITAYLNSGIKVMLHGKNFEAKDEITGEKLLPITYNGRTYMPLRAVVEAAGIEVDWEGETQTVYLGDKPKADVPEVAKDEIVGEDGIIYTPVTTEYVDVNDSAAYRLKSKEPKILNRGNESDFEFGYANDSIHAYYLRLMVDNKKNFDTFKARIWLEDTAESALQKAPFIEIIGLDGAGSILVLEGEAVKFGQYYDVEVDVKDVKKFYVRTNGVLSVIGQPMLGKYPSN